MARTSPTPMLLATASTLHADLRAAKKEWTGRLLGPTTLAAAADSGAPMMLRASARRISAPAAATPSKNVVGVGVAEKVVDGKATGILCVKFFVRTKYASAQLSSAERLPTAISGIPVDIEEVGVFRKFATQARRGAAAKTKKPKKPAVPSMPDPRKKIRPAQPGSSVGFQDPGMSFVMAGTFGALVKKGSTKY